MAVNVNMNMPRLREISRAAVLALEITMEVVHTDINQSQTMPFDDPVVIERRVYGKRGKKAKNGRVYKGKIVKEVKSVGGNLQNESSFIDFDNSLEGSVSLVNNTPYARRLYYHPEYNFDIGENPNAGGEWFEPYLNGDKKDFARKTFKKVYRKLARLGGR